MNLLALFGLIAVTATPSAPAPSFSLQFDGRWERVQGRIDGRMAGSSARSFHSGDVLLIKFIGAGFQIFGVTGPTGGHALVVTGDGPGRVVDFYSPAKRTNVLVYESPHLPLGRHAAAVVVVAARDPHSRGNYVNIGGVRRM